MPRFRIRGEVTYAVDFEVVADTPTEAMHRVTTGDWDDLDSANYCDFNITAGELVSWDQTGSAVKIED